MIRTDLELEITKSWIVRFEEALASLATDTVTSPAIVGLAKAATESQLDDLRAQVAEYGHRQHAAKFMKSNQKRRGDLLAFLGGWIEARRRAERAKRRGARS